MLVKGNEIVLCDMDTALFDCPERIGAFAGTQDFFAPELFRGPDSKKCDVFAFGCFLLDFGFNLGAPWDFMKPMRNVDNQTLNAYRNEAIKAAAYLEFHASSSIVQTIYKVGFWALRLDPPTPLSVKKMMFYLAKWALHPDPASRPTMQQICVYLSGNYTSQDDLGSTAIDFMEIERKLAYSDGTRK